MQVTASQARWLTAIVNSVVMGFFVSVVLNLLNFGFTANFLAHWPKVFVVSCLVSVPVSKFLSPYLSRVLGEMTGRPVARPTARATTGDLAPNKTGAGVQPVPPAAAPAASTPAAPTASR